MTGRRREIVMNNVTDHLGLDSTEEQSCALLDQLWQQAQVEATPAEPVREPRRASPSRAFYDQD